MNKPFVKNRIKKYFEDDVDINITTSIVGKYRRYLYIYAIEKYADAKEVLPIQEQEK